MPATRKRNLLENVKISITARFNSNHYGYSSDLIQGVLNTAWLSLNKDNAKSNSNRAAISARFVDINGDPLIPNHTMCSNLDEASRIFDAYYDEKIPVLQEERIEYIDNTNDTVTTVVS